MKPGHIASMLSLAIGKTDIHKDFLKNFFYKILTEQRTQAEDFRNYSPRTQRKYTLELKKAGWIEYKGIGKNIYYVLSPLFFEMVESILKNYKEVIK